MASIFPTIGHKAFSKQADYVFAGNAITNTQSSGYVRPFHETACNGFAFAPGELQKADLKHFIANGLPKSIEAEIKACNFSVIVYMIFHRNYDPSRYGCGKKKVIVDGWIVTKTEDAGKGLIKSVTTGPTYKSQSVIDSVLSVVSA